MNVENMTVLVVGLGKSGRSATKFLHSKGAKVIINDIKTMDELDISDLQLYYFKQMLGKKPQDCFEGVDLIVVSPGVSFDCDWIVKAKELGIKIVSETELAYWYIPCNIVAITGTNGKTTTTTLVGEIFKTAGYTVHVVGNIGTAITSKVNDMQKNDIVVCELSSFQIENCETFAPKVYAYLNLTPDHLDKHKTIENYANAKAKMMDYMDEDSFSVLNFEDKIVSSYKNKVKGKLLWFSSKQRVENGAYCLGNKVYMSIDNKHTYILNANEIKIMGNHNLENALAAIAMTFCLGITLEDISKTLKRFSGVAHRLEPVRTYNEITYINDSKGTNVDATLMAIKAMDKPTILIAGGYDKGANYDDMIKAFGDKICALVVTGETASKIENTALKYGFANIYKEKDFKEAVLKASKIASKNMNVLLSPCCASWDAFENFEQRGEYFKQIVNELE